MLRFQVIHTTPYLKLGVSARRKPMGYLVWGEAIEEIVTGNGRDYIHKTWRTVHGWRLVGLDGLERLSRRGIYEDKLEAARALASDTRYRT